MIQLAEKLAKRWMLTPRKGSNKPGWTHPENILKLYKNLLKPSLGELDIKDIKPNIVQLIWLHDILEDGKKEDRSKVTEHDLENFMFDEYIIQGIIWLTQDKRESKKQYLLSLKHAPYEVQVVKVLDRVSNLQEGKETRSEEWYKHYLRETKMYFPLFMYANSNEATPLLSRILYPENNWRIINE